MLGFDSVPACGMRGEVKGMANDCYMKEGIVVVEGLSFHACCNSRPEDISPFFIFNIVIFSSSSGINDCRIHFHSSTTQGFNSVKL